MPTVAVTLDLSCCRCRVKLEKILCRIQEGCGFVFDKVEYEKQGKVMITGTFDAIDLCCKIKCKARCFVTKVEILPPPKEPKETKDTKEDTKNKNNTTKPEKTLIPYPYPYPFYPCPQACPSSCPTPPDPCTYDPKPRPKICCPPPPPPPPPTCCPPPPPPPPPCAYSTCRPPCGYPRDYFCYEEPGCTVM